MGFIFSPSHYLLLDNDKVNYLVIMEEEGWVGVRESISFQMETGWNKYKLTEENLSRGWGPKEMDGHFEPRNAKQLPVDFWSSPADGPSEPAGSTEKVKFYGDPVN